MRKAPVICLIFLSALVMGLAVRGQSLDDQENTLNDVKRKLSDARTKANELKGKEKSLLGQLERTAEQIRLSKEVLGALRSKESRLNGEVKKLGDQLMATESKLVKQEALMEVRLREMYKRGGLYQMEILVSERSFSDMAKRYKYMILISDQDQKLYQNIKRQKGEIVQDRNKRESKLVTLTQVKGETEREVDNLNVDETQQKRLLSRVQREKESKESLVKDLQEAAKKLQRILDRLEKERKKDLAKNRNQPITPSYIEKLQGSLNWPADGKLYSSFGLKKHEKYNTFIQNNGIDILSAYQAPVRAVAAGKVVYAEKFLGYGNVVLIDHQSGFYTLYGNLSDIMVNTDSRVENHQQIGTVGGTAEGPILHFEVRKGGKPVDPVEWLKRKKGL
jgi:septal ring factor EnvC (AmiA/AmiB activator)